MWRPVAESESLLDPSMPLSSASTDPANVETPLSVLETLDASMVKQKSRRVTAVEMSLLRTACIVALLRRPEYSSISDKRRRQLLAECEKQESGDNASMGGLSGRDARPSYRGILSFRRNSSVGRNAGDLLGVGATEVVRRSACDHQIQRPILDAPHASDTLILRSRLDAALVRAKYSGHACSESSQRA